MNGIGKPQRDGNHRASQHPEAPIQRRILLGILVDSILTNSLLGHTNQAHETRCQRLAVDTDEAFAIRPRAPHRDESFFLFIQKPDSALVCADGAKRLCQHAGNALRALKVMQVQKGRYNGLSQSKRWRRLRDSSIEISGSLSTLKNRLVGSRTREKTKTNPKAGEAEARYRLQPVTCRQRVQTFYCCRPKDYGFFGLRQHHSLPLATRARIPHSFMFDGLLKCAWKCRLRRGNRRRRASNSSVSFTRHVRVDRFFQTNDWF
jgi:hypothetical protein